MDYLDTLQRDFYWVHPSTDIFAVCFADPPRLRHHLWWLWRNVYAWVEFLAR